MDRRNKTITIDEFRKLPDSEKGEMYKYLSDHDRYLWRITCPIGPGRPVRDDELSPEGRKHVTEIRKRLLKEGKITQETYDRLEGKTSEKD